MKVLVCGGREFSDEKKVESCLNSLHKKHGIDLIIEGGAKGADSLARIWANKKGIQVATYHANWKALGKRAGPVRNENMVRFGNPDCLVAFLGGIGTKGMVKIAKNNKLKVWETYL